MFSTRSRALLLGAGKPREAPLTLLRAIPPRAVLQGPTPEQTADSTPVPPVVHKQSTYLISLLPAKKPETGRRASAYPGPPAGQRWGVWFSVRFVAVRLLTNGGVA